MITAKAFTFRLNKHNILIVTEKYQGMTHLFLMLANEKRNFTRINSFIHMPSKISYTSGWKNEKRLTLILKLAILQKTASIRKIDFIRSQESWGVDHIIYGVLAYARSSCSAFVNFYMQSFRITAQSTGIFPLKLSW